MLPCSQSFWSVAALDHTNDRFETIRPKKKSEFSNQGIVASVIFDYFKPKEVPICHLNSACLIANMGELIAAGVIFSLRVTCTSFDFVFCNIKRNPQKVTNFLLSDTVKTVSSYTRCRCLCYLNFSPAFCYPTCRRKRPASVRFVRFQARRLFVQKHSG